MNKAEIEARLAAEIALRRERGEPFEPVVVTRKRGAVATTFWGAAWCDNLEAYGDFKDRLPAGKARLRAGAVHDLSIEPGEIFSYVTAQEIFEVLIRIDPVAPEQLETLRERCGGEIGSVLDLLSGKLGDNAMKALTDLDHGLIPRPEEIQIQCDCADYADVCPHSAAVLYAVGVRLDHEPELLFRLRDLPQETLVGGVVAQVSRLGEKAGVTTTDAGLRPETLSALFGIEITDPASAFGSLSDGGEPRQGSFE